MTAVTGGFYKCDEKSLKAVSRRDAEDLDSPPTLVALWKWWENSKTRGKGVCLGYCADHVRCDKNLDKDVPENNLMCVWRTEVTVVCLLDATVHTGDGKSQDAAQVSVGRTGVTFMGLMRKEQAPGRRYGNTRHSLGTINLIDKPLPERMHAWHKGMEATMAHDLPARVHRQLELENPISISCLVNENI